jgi:hypothetical protein
MERVGILLGTGAGRDVAEWWRQVRDAYSPVKAWAMVPLAMAGLAGLTWLHLCKGIAIGLLDRRWASAPPLLSIDVLVVIAVFGHWLGTSAEAAAWFSTGSGTADPPAVGGPLSSVRSGCRAVGGPPSSSPGPEVRR